MAGLEIGAKQQQIVVGFVLTQTQGPFGRFMELYPGVMKPGPDQYARIILLLDIIDRRLGYQVTLNRLVMRIAPFIVFRHRHRHGIILHGVQNIDKRHIGDRRREQIGAHIDRGRDEKPSGAESLDNQPVGRSIFCGDEVFGTSDKIGVAVSFLQQFPVLIP